MNNELREDGPEPIREAGNALADDLERMIRDPSLTGTVTLTKYGDLEVLRFNGEVVKIIRGASMDDL